MSKSATGRLSPAALLPPELLDQILSHLPYERATVQFRQKSSPRSFKSQLTFAHVCRAWRNTALASEYWPGVRMSLKSGKRLKEGLDHDNGNALLYVHIDMEHNYPEVTVNKRKQRAPLLALAQLPRIRTLFLKADPEDDEMEMNEDAGQYAWALGDHPAPELQDLTLGWLGEEKLELEFIKQPFPRLRYLALMGCDLTRHQTILQADNVVQANFWDVYVFETIDELVDTFSQWKRLEYVNISNSCLIGSGSKETKYKPRSAYLPALKEITFFDNTTDIGTFLTYVAFPPTTRADICFNSSSSTPELTRRVADAVHGHFDSPEGRSFIASAHALVISYPNGYEIQTY
ncbi:unnamed protein product [Peniophora sp. CBMAI 1063]|nr:unnamed protein product [Peniophora sp. CBMAI 1063]